MTTKELIDKINTIGLKLIRLKVFNQLNKMKNDEDEPYFNTTWLIEKLNINNGSNEK